MRDVNPGGGQHSASQAISHRAWSAPFFERLAGRRDGFPALLWAVLVNLILFGFFWTFATSVYDTNDDLVMQLIASGFYTGHPDAHLVFTNILVGWVLRFLYTLWSGHNWYLLYLVGAHFAALTAIAFLVISRRGGWLFTLLYAGFFLVVETHILLRLQFTTTAFLTGTAGLLLLVDGLQPNRPVRWSRVVAGFAFWGLMCLIREPVAPFLAVVASPFLLERFGRPGWRRLCAAGMVCAGILLLLHGANRWAYRVDSPWAEYAEYNRLRGEIQDMAPAEHLPQADAAVGWSRNDGWMFSEFYFSEPAVYAGVPRMRLLLDTLKRVNQVEPHPGWSGMPASYLFLPAVFTRAAAILMVLAMLNGIWCVFVAGSFRYRCLTALLVSYGLYIVLALFLLMTAHLPERVSYNFPLFLNAICLYWATGFRTRPDAAVAPRAPNVSADQIRPASLSHWTVLRTVPVWAAANRGILRCGRVFLLLLVLIWVVLYLFNLSQLTERLLQENASNQKLERISHKIMNPIGTLMAGQTRPLLITMPADSILEQCLVFCPSAEKLPFFLVPTGWTTHSPLFNQILQRHQLHPYSLSLLDRPDVFFLMQLRWRDPLKLFYREHYGLKIRFDLVLNTDPMPAFEDCQLHLYQAHVVSGIAPTESAR